MNAEYITCLARLDPDHLSNTGTMASTFTQVYLNPAFGWEIAISFARARQRFPVSMLGRDHWFSKAYLRNMSARFPNSDVAAAHIHSTQKTSTLLQVLRIAGLGDPVSEHLDLIAEKTGIPRRIVDAYESLFFNVLERHNEGSYISNIVYPEGRLVVLEEDYFEETPIHDLLLRAAYNHKDVDLVMHLFGLGPVSLVKELGALRNLESELEKEFMGTGILAA